MTQHGDCRSYYTACEEEDEAERFRQRWSHLPIVQTPHQRIADLEKKLSEMAASCEAEARKARNPWCYGELTACPEPTE